MNDHTLSLIANSRMYNVAPQTRAAWDALFAIIIQQSGLPLRVIDHAFPTPIKELWARQDMGCVLMCGYPYALASPRPQLLAAPAPTLPRYQRKPITYSDFLVAEDSDFQTIEDSFGGRVCWTVDYSQSGFNALRRHLLPYRNESRPTLYRESIGPIGTFSVGIEMMRRGEVDLVPIDGYYHDLLRLYAPQKVAGTRVIATTQPYPMPAFVAGCQIAPQIAFQLKERLLAIHQEPAAQAALNILKIEHFAAVSSDYYDALLVQEKEALEADYPMPA